MFRILEFSPNIIHLKICGRFLQASYIWPMAKYYLLLLLIGRNPSKNAALPLTPKFTQPDARVIMEMNVWLPLHTCSMPLYVNMRWTHVSHCWGLWLCGRSFCSLFFPSSNDFLVTCSWLALMFKTDIARNSKYIPYVVSSIYITNMPICCK